MKNILGLLLCFVCTSFAEICELPLVFNFDTAPGSGARLKDADSDWLKAHGITVHSLPKLESGDHQASGRGHFTEAKNVSNPSADPPKTTQQVQAEVSDLGSGNSRIVFKFDNPITVQQVGLVDIDSLGVLISVMAQGGGRMSLKLPPADTRSNQVIDISMDKVEELTVIFPGHGAVSSLNVCSPVSTSTTTTHKQRLRQALVINPTSPQPTPTNTLKPTLSPISFSDSCDPISFQGVAHGYSFEKGSIVLEWDPVIQEVFINQSSTLLPCNNVSYYVFFAPEKYDYNNHTVSELLADRGIVYVRTEDLRLNKTDLGPNKTYSILVVAGSDKDFSENRDSIEVTTSSVDPKLGSNVSYVGLFEASDALTINFDKQSRLVFQSTKGLPQDIQTLVKGKHLAVVASDGSHHIFLVTSIAGTVSETQAAFEVAKQHLGDLFEELEFDISSDVAKGNQEAVVFPDPSRRRMAGFQIDRTVTIDKTATFGPLKVRGKISLRAYLRARLRIKWFSVKEASITVGGSESTLASISYTRVENYRKTFKQRIFTGPSATLGPFVIVIIPVWIDFQPVLDVAGSVTASLEANFQVTVTQEASIEAFAGYKNGWKAYVHTDSSKSITANVGGKAKVTAEAGVILSLRIVLESIIGVTIGVGGGLNCAAEASLITNPVILRPPSILPVQLSKFDVGAFFRVPVGLTSIFGDHDFGNLYEVTVPLLALPKFDIKKVSVATCDANSNAIVLKAKATLRPYHLLIGNDLTNRHRWWDDFNPQNSLSENADPNSKFYDMEGANTMQVTLKLRRTNGILGNTAAQLGNQLFDIPAGRLYFRTTPKIPGLPYSLVSSVDIRTLFGSLRLECCETEDCAARYNQEVRYCRLANHSCVRGNPPIYFPPNFLRPPTRRPTYPPFPPFHIPPSLLTFPTLKPSPDVPRRTSAVPVDTNRTVHAGIDGTG